MSSHQFSIYFESLSSFISDLRVGDETEFKDSNLVKRVIDVLRLKEGDVFLLFDDEKNAKLILLNKNIKSKKKLFVKIDSINNNKSIKPEIILCPALLKKKHFEEVVYLAAAMAVTKIIPILSGQVHKNWLDQKNIDRLKKIMITACEQSKNFFIPKIENPIDLKDFLEKESFDNSKKACFHVNGKPISSLLLSLNQASLDQTKPKKIYLFFGPEGDYSFDELSLFKKIDIETYKLTPTVLRSVDAVSVGLGLVRSVAE